MAKLKGTAGIIDDFSVTVSRSISNTITGLGSEDFLSLNFKWTIPDINRLTYFITKVDTDLVISVQNLVTEKILSTSTFQNYYDSNGLPYIENVNWSHSHNRVITEQGSIGFAKIPSSKSEAASLFEPINNPDGRYEIIGTNNTETLCGLDGNDYWNDDSVFTFSVFNLFNDNAGNDTIIGGNSSDDHYVVNYYRVGAGNDLFQGGIGSYDKYIFASLSSSRSKTGELYTKTIEDFNVDEGDNIELAKLANAHNLKFNTSRTYTSDTNATWKRGDIIFQVKDADGDGDMDGIILANTDRDKAPEIKIVLIGVTYLGENSLNLEIDYTNNAY
jgi:hypothetical protein